MLVKERTLWVDSCRFFAIFVIMSTHFLAEFFPGALALWETPPSSWLLYGLTGKFSVAFFFVLLGYYASRPASFSAAGFLRYGMRRYVQFAFYIFVCTALYIVCAYCSVWLFHSPGESVLRLISDGPGYNLIYLLRDSFLFEDNYNATLWCMQQLFIASLVCRALAYLPERLGLLPRMALALGLMACLMLINGEYCVWICAAVLGYVLRLLLGCDALCSRLSARPVLIAAAAAALFMIKLKMPESTLQYSLQSLAALLLIFLHFRLPAVQRLLSAGPFPRLGSISMGLFVVHTPINALLMSTVYALLPGVSGGLICYILSIGLSIAGAGLLHRLYALVPGEKKAAISV